MKRGPRNLITDVAGLRAGSAEDAILRSGATVLVGDEPFTAAVHVMGGAPGTRETDLLAPDKAARLAQAAWAVSSDGAEVTESVLNLIRSLTDGAG